MNFKQRKSFMNMWKVSMKSVWQLYSVLISTSKHLNDTQEHDCLKLSLHLYCLKIRILSHLSFSTTEVIGLLSSSLSLRWLKFNKIIRKECSEPSSNYDWNYSFTFIYEQPESNCIHLASYSERSMRYLLFQTFKRKKKSEREMR